MHDPQSGPSFAPKNANLSTRAWCRSLLPVPSLALAFTALLGSSPAAAQCVDWESMGNFSGVRFNGASTARMFDPDGPGPTPPVAVVAGNFSQPGDLITPRIASFDGTRWAALGGGLGGGDAAGPYALGEFDPDQFGPLPPRLIVGADFTTAGAVPARSIAAWDGASWHPLGTGITGHIHALATWDPDGPGRQPPSLYAGGLISAAGDIQTGGIARWDGTRWHALAGGVDGAVRSITPFDPDGPGPEPELIIVAGDFTHAGALQVNRIAAWDGSTWSRVGEGVSGSAADSIRATAILENPSGSAALFVAGSFTRAGEVNAQNVARWDGHSWHAVGTTPLGFLPSALGVVDFDAQGDRAPELYIGGFSSTLHISRLTNNTWEPLPLDPLTFQQELNGLAQVDLGGTGPRARGLCATGWFNHIAGIQVFGVGLWDGSRWWPWGPQGVGAAPNAMATWDRDGAGPAPRVLVVGGALTTAGGLPVSSVATWDGYRWDALAGPSNGPAMPGPSAIHIMDFDADGPEPESIVVGGLFSVPNIDTRCVARWNGSRWLPFGGGLSSSVAALGDFDPDNDGPLPRRLVAGGHLNPLNGASGGGIAQWTGAAWAPIGQGFLDDFGFGPGEVHALTTFDSDGPGPLPSRLIAGGLFRSSAGTITRNIAAFDGSQWLPLGPGLSADVLALTTFDPDGPGPALTQLIAGGKFTSTGDGTVALNKLARWNGLTWAPIGQGVSGTVSGLKVRDPDGPGPLPDWLFINGNLSSANGQPSDGLAAWDGTTWTTFDPGPNGEVLAAEVYQPTTDDEPSLFISGRFAIVADVPSPGLAQAHLLLPPAIDSEPQDLSLASGDDATFDVHATGGHLSYRWSRNGAQLSDGPTADGTHISGASSATLHLSNIHLADQGNYSVLIQNACGLAESRPALLSVSCDADFDHNGSADFFDYLDFIAAFAAQDPRADLDRNGQIDFFDYLAFVSIFSAGC